MEKYIITTGKTIDLAVSAALDQLQMDRDSVSVEVLDNPKSGFLGIGATPARVKVTYEAPDEAPAPALSAASRSKPKSEKPVSQPAAPATPPAAPVPKAEKSRKRVPKKRKRQQSRPQLWSMKHRNPALLQKRPNSF